MLHNRAAVTRTPIMRESGLSERFHNVIGVRAEEEVLEKRLDFFLVTKSMRVGKS